jgi:hypothetical protein
MSEYQVMRWREIPSMVIARDGADTIKSMLPARFQEAIDEAAMRMGEVDADAYTAGWNRDPWTQSDENPTELAARITLSLEEEFSEEKITALLESLGKA